MENENGKQKTKGDVLNSIINNYSQLEKSIVEQLYLSYDLHGGTIGSQREDIWRQLFEMIIPRKFVIEQSVFIIDSKDGFSREVDLAIIDETYTPYIFRYGRLKFVPVEAVAAVVECKSQSLGDAKAWSFAIDALETSCDSIVRIAPSIAIGKFSKVLTQTSTRPIKIFCGLLKSVSEETKKCFDFMLLAINEEKNPHIDVAANKGINNLKEWYEQLNHHRKDNKDREQASGEKHLENIELSEYEVSHGGKTIPLLTFNFQLNQLLMLINNPLFFPHRAYVEMFNKINIGE